MPLGQQTISCVRLGQQTISCVQLGQQFMRAYLYSSNTLCNEVLALCNYLRTQNGAWCKLNEACFIFYVLQANAVTLIKMSLSGESQ